jgi:hypothetical protein
MEINATTHLKALDRYKQSPKPTLMKTAFILQHSYELEGEEETKFIGVYSSEEEANSAIERLKEKPGFVNWQECFSIGEYHINQDHWTEGFSTMTSVQIMLTDQSWSTVSAEIIDKGIFKIIEYYKDDLGIYKNLDIIRCEEKNGQFFAVEVLKRE